MKDVLSLLRRPLRALREKVRYLRLPADLRQNYIYDQITFRIIRDLGQGANCVDIGASTGMLLKEMVAACPEGQHFAFEARPDAATALAQRFPGVSVHPVALGNRAGEVTFNYVRANPGYSGLRRQNYPLASPNVDEIRVPMMRLDDVIPPELPIAFIKLVVEGAEYMVLEGARETCIRCKPLIMFAYGDAGKSAFGTTPEQIYNLLHAYGLGISALTPGFDGRHPLDLAAFQSLSAAGEYHFVAHP